MSDEPARGTLPPDPAPLADDPTERSRWRPVFRLLSDMDDEIAQVYADNGIDDLKPNWVLEIIRLHVRGPMTIAELARSVGRTHSALSQKVAAMRAAGWLETTPGADARSKRVTLTAKAERVAGLLAAEWRATEAVDHRDRVRAAVPAHPRRRRHPRRAGPQELPRPHHRPPAAAACPTAVARRGSTAAFCASWSLPGRANAAWARPRRSPAARTGPPPRCGRGASPRRCARPPRGRRPAGRCRRSARRSRAAAARWTSARPRRPWRAAGSASRTPARCRAASAARASASSGAIAASRGASSCPSSAARATARSQATRLAAMPGSASAVSSRSGSGNAGISSPATVGMAPSSAQIRVRTAAACARYRLALMIDQAAASYGEWNRTGRSQSCSRCSAPSTGSRSPAAAHGRRAVEGQMRRAWRGTASCPRRLDRPP